MSKDQAIQVFQADRVVTLQWSDPSSHNPEATSLPYGVVGDRIGK